MKMPRKPARSDAQVEHLAAQLQERWTTADGIMPWLRRRLPLLSRLHQDEGWSWDDIGRALDVAGITYKTGRPWTGLLLARKIGQARLQVRARKTAQKLGSEAPRERRSVITPAVLGSGHRASKSATPLPGGSEEVPTFAPASLARNNFIRPAPPPDGVTPTKSPSPRRPVDVDAVIRRLQGAEATSDNEG